MQLRPIVYALTLAARPSQRARWLRRGFRKIREEALLAYWERRLAIDDYSRQLAEKVWQGYERHRAAEAAGPGSRLEALLAFFGIVPVAGCKCRKRAAEMNTRGVNWCAAHRDLIVEWMREEAARRGWPFFAPAARALLAIAIAWSRYARAHLAA